MGDLDQMIAVGDEQISLADLAGISYDETVAVKGGLRFPKGVFKWKVAEAGFDVSGEDENKKAIIKNKLTCLDVISLADDGVDGADFIGKDFYHISWLTKPVEGLGQQKDFMQMAGFQGSGDWQTMLADFAGTEFIGEIVHRVNRNDKDHPYVNLDVQSCSPATEQVAAAQAGNMLMREQGFIFQAESEPLFDVFIFILKLVFGK